MIVSKKIRIKPTAEQVKLLWKSVGVARWVFNWTLERQQENYQKGLKFCSDNDLRKEITQLKKTEAFNWLGDVSNNVAKQAVKDACEAYKRFFKGLAQRPRFKSRKRSKPSFYNDNCKLKVKPQQVLIEKVGWLRTSEQLPMGVKYSNPRVSFDGKYWYISVGVEETQVQVELTDEVIGIDLGIKDLAICSNGMKFKNINKTATVKKIEKRLRRLQRSVSKKYEMNKEGSRFVKTCNIVKIEQDIRKLHRRLTNLRTNHCHQATSTIVKTKPCRIVLEDLNVRGMMKNRHLANAIAKQKFYEFTRQIKYKSEKLGIEVLQVGRFFPSSKTCSNCGTIKTDLRLADRTFKCSCGYTEDRDVNASLNLANYGKSIA